MRTLRQFFLAYLFILTLTLTAVAGEMTTGITPPQSDTSHATTSGEMSTPLNGNMHTGVNGVISTPDSEESAAGGSVVADVLALVRSVLSLL